MRICPGMLSAGYEYESFLLKGARTARILRQITAVFILAALVVAFLVVGDTANLLARAVPAWQLFPAADRAVYEVLSGFKVGKDRLSRFTWPSSCFHSWADPWSIVSRFFTYDLRPLIRLVHSEFESTETSKDSAQKNPATDENDAFLPWLKALARCSLFLRNPQPADRSAGYLRLCIHSHPIGGRAPGPVR